MLLRAAIAGGRSCRYFAACMDDAAAFLVQSALGKSVENPCEVRGNSVEIPWKIRGNFVENPWKNRGKFVENSLVSRRTDVS